MATRVKVNSIGLEKRAYEGKDSTLCVGCGHNSISSQITQIVWEMGLEQHNIIKLSGIGCSSKTPAYFLGGSHGFNSVHGRMPSVATGAVTANRRLKAIGISGDGDSGSIGMGQYKHLMRRNIPMVYIIENNGVYGLTKGQFSATADLNQFNKYAGGINNLPPFDLCYEAIICGAGFVARSFSGDKNQVQALLQAALNYQGLAVLDIISPCVTFNDHLESSKGYEWVKKYNEIINDVSFVMEKPSIEVDYQEGESIMVQMHDGGFVRLNKLGKDHDPRDRASAIRLLESRRNPEDIVTGLIYINEEQVNGHQLMNLPDTPLVELSAEQIRPSQATFQQIMRDLHY